MLVSALVAALALVTPQSISDSPDPARWGDDITYTVTIVNNSGQPQNDVRTQGGLSGTLEKQSTIKSATSSRGACEIKEIQGFHEYICHVDGTLEPGGTATSKIVVHTPSPGVDGGHMNLSASATIGDPAENPDGQSNYVDEETSMRRFNGTANGQKLVGTSKADSLTGGAFGDKLYGFGGEDTLNGAGGNDY